MALLLSFGGSCHFHALSVDDDHDDPNALLSTYYRYLQASKFRCRGDSPELASSEMDSVPLNQSANPSVPADGPGEEMNRIPIPVEI